MSRAACSIRSSGNRRIAYIIALEDAGWLDPAERTVTLSTRLSGAWTLIDRLSGVALGLLTAPLQLQVPAGGLRPLEARRKWAWV